MLFIREEGNHGIVNVPRKKLAGSCDSWMKAALAMAADQIMVLKERVSLENSVHTVQTGQVLKKDFAIDPYRRP